MVNPAFFNAVFAVPTFMVHKILMMLAVISLLFVGASGFWQEYRLLLLGLTAAFNLSVVIFSFISYRQSKKRDEDQEIQADAAIPEALPPIKRSKRDDELLLLGIPNFLCLKDADGRWLLATDEYLAFFNLQDVDYIGKSNIELANYPESNAHALKLAHIQDKSVWHAGHKLKESAPSNVPQKEGHIFEITRIPVFTSETNRSKLILVGEYVRQIDKVVKQDKNQTVIDELESYQQCCDAHFNLISLDRKFAITQVNPHFCKVSGYSQADVIGNNLSAIVIGEFIPGPEAFRGDDGVWSCELICKHKQGPYFPIKLNMTQIIKNDQVNGYFVSLFDITRQKQVEKRIMQIAHYDDLTGLVNRTMFFDRLNQALAKNDGNYIVVFFIDLDRFKTVNDSLGHDAGDQLLKQTGARLQEVARKKDIVARLSGDEFALLMLKEVSHEQAIYAASMTAEKIIQRLAEPFYIDRNEVFIGASIGISIYPEDAKTSEELLKRADISMYEAKKLGRNNYQFYKSDYTSVSQDRLEMEMDLRKAIEKNQLQLYYQPQYKAMDGTLCGAEVLIRWIQGPSYQPKMVSPDKFIGLAEETGLIVEIGQWIMETACLQMKKWVEDGYTLPQISVNVSARQFSDDKFLQGVEEAIVGADLDPQYLELELTESMLIGDIKQIELQLQRIKKMGIAIVLDDFGTGYSSLSYLKNFPIDVLKIDQSFIKGTALYTKNARIACAIINMGHSLGQKIVAEGVETEEQLMFLKNRGCDIIQGYYFSKPLPVNEMTALLREEAAGVGLGKKKAFDNPDTLFN